VQNPTLCDGFIIVYTVRIFSRTKAILSWDEVTHGGARMAQSTPDVEQTVKSYVDVWNTGDYAKIPDVVAESATIYDPGAPKGELHGRDGVESHLRELRSGFPDFTITIEDMLSSDEVAMVEWTVTATHEGEFDDIPPTGQQITLRGMSKTVITDGKVREDRIYHDFHEFLDQLGLVND